MCKLLFFSCSLALKIGGTFSGPGISGTFFSPTLAGSGTHQITYAIVEGSCVVNRTQSTTVSSAISVSFSGLAVEYCQADSKVVLTAIPVGGNWTGYVTNVVGNVAEFDPGTAPLGTYDITYTGMLRLK